MNRVLLPVLVACGMCAISATTIAQEPEVEREDSEPEAESGIEEARTRFRRGVEFYNAGDHRAALIEFERAYEIAPNYRVLFNLGQASFQLHDYAEAQEAFERYLAEGGDEIPEERRREVAEELNTLRQYVSRLTIEINVDGTEISVDDQLIGMSPLQGPVTLSAGRREVSVRREGYAPTARIVDLAGGEDASLELNLVPLSMETVVAPTKLSTGFWASLITTGVVGVAAVTTGVLALQANDDLDAALTRFPADGNEIDASRQRTERLALTTDILIGAAGIGAVTTLLVALFGGETDNDEEVAIRATGNGVQISF